METLSTKGHAGQPIKAVRKIEILADFEARQEFQADCNNCRVKPVKCSSFARIARALKDLGLDKETEEDQLNLALAYADKFRDTYSKLALR